MDLFSRIHTTPLAVGKRKKEGRRGGEGEKKKEKGKDVLTIPVVKFYLGDSVPLGGVHY